MLKSRIYGDDYVTIAVKQLKIAFASHVYVAISSIATGGAGPFAVDDDSHTVHVVTHWNLRTIIRAQYDNRAVGLTGGTEPARQDRDVR